MGQEDDSVEGVNSVALPGCCHLCTHTKIDFSSEKGCFPVCKPPTV